MDQLTLKEFQNISPLTDTDVFKFLNVEGSVSNKMSIGGASFNEVMKQIKKAKKIISTYEKI